MIDKEEINHESFGNLYINKAHTNGINLFGNKTGDNISSLINIRFNKSTLINVLKQQTFFNSSNVLELLLSKNQWATLLTTVNNSKGVPCTITFREDIKRTILDYNKLDSHNEENEFNKIKKLFEEDMKKIFPDLDKRIKKLNIQVNQDIIESFERNQILKDIEGIIQSFYDNKEKVLNSLSKNIEKLDNTASIELSNQIKTNFFNFNLPKDIEEAKSILLKSSQNLGFNLLEKEIKEEVLPTESHEGVIVLKEIESNYFIADNECKNGYSIEVYEANKTKLNNTIIINPGKKLVEYQLSVNQFSDLLTSFGESRGITCTIKETINLKNIEPYTENKNDDFDLKFREFENLFVGRNKQLDDILETFKTNLKTKNITKTKQKEMEKNINTIMYRSYSDVLYIFNSLVDVRNKSINKKLNDVLTSLTKGIKNLGVKSFIDNLKNNDKTLLENIAKKHSTNKLLKNDNKEANLDDTILSM